jgi:hypothetical protein
LPKREIKNSEISVFEVLSCQKKFFLCEKCRQNEKIKGNILLHYALFLEKNRQIPKRKLIFLATLGL